MISGQRGAIFAFEALDKIQAIFEFLVAGGINLQALGVSGQFALQLLESGHGLLVQFHKRRRAWVKSLQLLQAASDRTGLFEDRAVILCEGAENGLTELKEAGGIAGALKFLLELRLFVCLSLAALISFHWCRSNSSC